MNLQQLSFDDLMRECSFTDVAEFRRVLKRNQFQIARDKPIAFDDADAIVRRLQRRSLDRYRYKQEVRDEQDGGPLRWSDSREMLRIATDWETRLGDTTHVAAGGGSSILGFACEGGFLGGADEPFAFRIDRGVNILIGERGAGKSTALSLFGLLAARGLNPARVLLARLVGLHEERDAETDKTRRIRQMIRYYGVTRYACFYVHGGRHFAYIVDLAADAYSLVVKAESGWQFVSNEDNGRHLPTMHVLQQGEVFKIADETNRHYLNVLVDVLFPEVRESREKFLRRVRKLAAQYRNYSGRTVSREHVNRLLSEQFITHRLAEVRQILHVARRQRVTEREVAIIREWIEHVKFDPLSYEGRPLHELLQGDEAALWFVLFARMARFLRMELPYILEHIESGRIDPPRVESENVPAVEEPDSDDEPASEVEELPDHEPVAADRLGDHWELMRSIARRVRARLRTIEVWVDQFADLSPLDEQTKGLAAAYIDYVQKRSELLEKQQSGCLRLQDVLNRDSTVHDTNIHRVNTRNVGVILSDLERVVRSLENLPASYELTQTFTAHADPMDVNRALSTYDDSMDELQWRCSDIASRADNTELDAFFDPIEIDLKQGSDYMPFEKLSFGQRSGIILKIVLGTTPHHIIILDQPEDNLDAHAVEAVAVALKNLGLTRQVIVATHHSSLVMGIPDARLHVMASHGNVGVLRDQGRLTDRDLTRAVLDVLEGGEESFQHKMRIYADFLERLQGFIRDMDVSEIESTFRRRTIDGLRNFLQPVVSSESMLRFYRHELKQPTMASPDLKNAQEAIERLKANGDCSADLLEKLDRVIAGITVHINQFQRKIEELRMLDTRPHPELIDLGVLLEQVALSITERQQERQIVLHFDPTLRGMTVYFDPQHLRLVFDNLFNNALRATEQPAMDALDREELFTEHIEVSVHASDPRWVTLHFTDNGRGIPQPIRDKLYLMKCSDQYGDHGLGGIIIRKMLDLNGSEISILESGPQIGTKQEIRLRRNVPL